MFDYQILPRTHVRPEHTFDQELTSNTWTNTRSGEHTFDQTLPARNSQAEPG